MSDLFVEREIYDAANRRNAELYVCKDLADTLTRAGFIKRAAVTLVLVTGGHRYSKQRPGC